MSKALSKLTSIKRPYVIEAVTIICVLKVSLITYVLNTIAKMLIGSTAKIKFI